MINLDKLSSTFKPPTFITSLFWQSKIINDVEITKNNSRYVVCNFISNSGLLSEELRRISQHNGRNEIEFSSQGWVGGKQKS